MRMIPRVPSALRRTIVEAFRDQERTWTSAELAGHLFDTTTPTRSQRRRARRAAKSAIRAVRETHNAVQRLELATNSVVFSYEHLVRVDRW